MGVVGQSGGFLGSSAAKEYACKAGGPGSIPGSGRSPGEGVAYPVFMDFPGGSDSRNPPAMWETWVRLLGLEDPLEEGMATHSRILGWRIPMDRGAWWATVHGVTELDTTEP